MDYFLFTVTPKDVLKIRDSCFKVSWNLEYIKLKFNKTISKQDRFEEISDCVKLKKTISLSKCSINIVGLLDPNEI